MAVFAGNVGDPSEVGVGRRGGANVVRSTEMVRVSDRCLWQKFGPCLKSKFNIEKLRNLILKVVSARLAEEIITRRQSKYGGRKINQGDWLFAQGNAG